jgi:P-type E1-E2 ATPase
MKPRVQRPPFFDSLKDQLNDRVIILVGIFAILSIIPGMVVEPSNGWVEGVFILVALVLQVLITSWNDYSKDNKFVELQSLNREENVPVLRGKKGSMQTISVWNLVVGDIVMMQPGDKVPADCIVLSSANLHVNEPTKHVELDGPTTFTWNKLKKNANESPFLFADSYILAGTCKVVVCCVGENSSRGNEDTKYDTREEETELTQKLSVIETSLKFMALISAIVILGTALVVLFLQVGVND